MRAIVDPAIADIRFALAGAAIVLPLLGLASPLRQRRGWVAPGAGAFGICATYYALLWVAEYAERHEGAPVVAMWCPNLVVGAGAALLLITERPRDSDRRLLRVSEY
jgi:lipopolysaccharide export LptBFGC system permease protein LptF